MRQNNRIDISGIWVVIPAFNNKATVFSVAEKCRRRIEQVLVVDDGSTDADLTQLFKGTDIAVISHPTNLGKGKALVSALRYLKERGAQVMLTIDADGQHDPGDIDRFIPLIQEDPSAIIIGVRDFNSADVPGKSRFGRSFSNFWLYLETGKVIEDSQSGFRAYPVKYLSQMNFAGRYYDFEVEVLVRAAWSGLEFKQVGIKVFYPPAEERVSSFRPFLDNARIALMHTRLIGRRLFPLPYPKLVKLPVAVFGPEVLLHPVKLIKGMVKESASAVNLAVAAAVGTFLGVLPIPGLHIVTTIYVASRLHLNKIMALGIQNLCMPPFVPVTCMELGHFMLYGKWLTIVSFKTVFGEITARLWEWFLGSLILAPVLSIFTGVVVYFISRVVQKKKSSYAIK